MASKFAVFALEGDRTLQTIYSSSLRINGFGLQSATTIAEAHTAVVAGELDSSLGLILNEEVENQHVGIEFLHYIMVEKGIVIPVVLLLVSPEQRNKIDSLSTQVVSVYNEAEKTPKVIVSDMDLFGVYDELTRLQVMVQPKINIVHSITLFMKLLREASKHHVK
jgi:hypothetical protein